MKKIALLKIGALGDVLMTTPLLRQLRAALPDAQIDYVVGRSCAAVLDGNPHISSVVCFDESILYTRRLLELPSLVRLLRGYDAVLVLDKHWVFALIALLAGIRVRVGFARRFVDGLFLTRKVPYGPVRHEIAYYLALGQALGVPIRLADVAMDLPAGEPRHVRTPYTVLINAGGVNANEQSAVRRMPEPLFSSLVDACIAKGTVVFLGTKDESARYEKFADARAINLCGRTSLREAWHVLEHAEAVYSTDTGLMHMAGALNPRLTAIFGPTHPARKCPPGARSAWTDQDVYDGNYELYGRVPRGSFFQAMRVEDILAARTDTHVAAPRPVNTSTDPPVVAAVINWNGWRDTTICLRSMFGLVGPPVNVVVCDNASTDGSIAHLSRWLCEEAGGTIESRAVVGDGAQLVAFSGSFGSAVKGVYLLCLPENFGYAGGANRCITWGREALGAQDFWVLNNDIKVHPDALAALVEATTATPAIGLCGSVLLDWDDPGTVQAVGGKYSRWIASGSHFTELPSDACRAGAGFLPLDYPVGASLFITHSYLETVGLMDETYFLYYEEIDWAQRGRAHGFTPGVALGSLVQHKEGASTGSHGGVRKKSLLSERYGVVNRLRVTRKFWPLCLPLVWMSLWLVLLDRLAHAEWPRARLVFKLMFSPQLWLADRPT